MASEVPGDDDIAIVAITVAELRVGTTLARGKPSARLLDRVFSLLEVAAVLPHDTEVQKFMRSCLCRLVAKAVLVAPSIS